MKHVSILFRSKCWNVFLLLCIALPSLAQKEFKIDEVKLFISSFDLNLQKIFQLFSQNLLHFATDCDIITSLE